MGNCAHRQNTSDENHLHASSIARAGSLLPERNPSAGTRLKELQGQFKSDIKLDIQIITRFPSFKDTMITVTYKVDYGRSRGKWNEQNIKLDNHTSKCLELEYIFGDKKQEIVVEIEASA
jgi:hypothetical protein